MEIEGIMINLKNLRTEVKALQEKMLHPKFKVVRDKVKGSSPESPWNERSFKIEGYVCDEEEPVLTALEQKREEYRQQVEKLEQWLEEAVKEPKLRIIMRMRHKEGLEWPKIGKRMGLHEATVRTLHNEFIKNIKGHYQKYTEKR